MNEQQKKDYEESLKIAKSFNFGFAKGLGIFAIMNGITGGFSKEW